MKAHIESPRAVKKVAFVRWNERRPRRSYETEQLASQVEKLVAAVDSLQAQLTREAERRAALEQHVEALETLLMGADGEEAVLGTSDYFNQWCTENMAYVRANPDVWIALHRSGEVLKVTQSDDEIGEFSAQLTDAERGEVIVFHTSTLQ